MNIEKVLELILGVFVLLVNNKVKASVEYHCGTLELELCDGGGGQRLCTLNRTRQVVQWKEGDKSSKGFMKVGGVDSVSTADQCHLTLCDDLFRMGYCAQFPPGVEAHAENIKGIFLSDSLGVHCKCSNGTVKAKKPYSDEEFDRNYVGVVYSPYDKYWEPTGPNGTLRRISWKDYSQQEITQSLKQISQNFSYVATYGMGTASNTSSWNEGDKIAFVPYLSSKINLELGYLALRISIGIFRKDDVKLEWKSKELYNALDAAKVANRIFNGTVWGITVTSDFVQDSVNAAEAIRMINEVKEINVKEGLYLKVGIRLKTCSEFIANKRPEDDAVPIYQQENPFMNQSESSAQASLVTLTGYQASLHEIARTTDFILCDLIPSPSLGFLPLDKVIKSMQTQFTDLRNALKIINPNLKLVIETGIPSQGVGNGFKNSLRNQRDYWRSMAQFAKKEHIMFHMFEAIDQPWKNVMDRSFTRVDKNGPNGTDAHYGWWRRLNNSEPPVYIEKVTEIKEGEEGRSLDPDGIFRIVVMSFVAFVLLTLCIVAYLWRKLYKAKTQVISQAYVNQFHSGGDESNVDDNYAVALRIPYDRKLELAEGTFEIDKSAVMGSGKSGIVYCGRIQCHTKRVAFKCTTPNSSVVDIKAIMSEIKILSYLGHHQNLVCILGAYTKKIQRGKVYVALEYCELGNLESYIRRANFEDVTDRNFNQVVEASRYVTLGGNGILGATNPGYVADFGKRSCPKVSDYLAHTKDVSVTLTLNRKDTVKFQTLLKWSMQIASAMEYVSAMGVIHADLAARNVLLASLDQVKISDFGLSRKMYQELGVTYDKDTPLPWRWMAPESLKHLDFSSKSDVWAFGVTLWEMFSLGEVPYHGISYNMQFAEELEKGMRLPRPKYATYEIYQAMMECWNIRTIDRPCFKELHHLFLYLVDKYSQSQIN